MASWRMFSVPTMATMLLSGGRDKIVAGVVPGVIQPSTGRAGWKEKGRSVALQWLLYEKIMWILQVTQRDFLGEE